MVLRGIRPDEAAIRGFLRSTGGGEPSGFEFRSGLLRGRPLRTRASKGRRSAFRVVEV